MTVILQTSNKITGQAQPTDQVKVSNLEIWQSQQTNHHKTSRTTANRITSTGTLGQGHDSLNLEQMEGSTRPKVDLTQDLRGIALKLMELWLHQPQTLWASAWSLRTPKKTTTTTAGSRSPLLSPVKKTRIPTSSLLRYRLYCSERTQFRWIQRQFNLKTTSQPKPVRRSAVSSSHTQQTRTRESLETTTKTEWALSWTSLSRETR